MFFPSQKVHELLRDEAGQDLIEYALLASLIGLFAVASMKTLANAVKNVFADVGTTLTNAT